MVAHRVIAEDIKNIVNNIKKEARALEGKTLLISGGAGFLGSYIVGSIDYLNKNVFSKPCRVLCVDNYITGSKKGFIVDLDPKYIIKIRRDITRPLRITESVHFIIHAAGLASPVYYQRYPLETIYSAVQGAKNLLEFGHKKRGLESFLFFSSSEIYGDPHPDFVPTPESYKGNVSCTGPRACYDESKRLAETICMTYYRLYNMPIKIVRPFNVYGPGMRKDDYRVIPTFLTKALAGEFLPVHNKGNQTRTFCYISDAVVGFFKVLLLGDPGEAYNVGWDKEEINIGALASIVAGIFDNKVPVKTVEYPDVYPADEPQRRCPDLTKIRALGYNPCVDLNKGLIRTLCWFRDTYGGDVSASRLV